MDRLLHLARGGGRDDAAHLLALHWLPRLQGQLHHVVVRNHVVVCAYVHVHVHVHMHVHVHV